MGMRKVYPEEVIAAKRESKRRQFAELGGFLYARGLPDGRFLYLAPGGPHSAQIVLGIARNFLTHSYYAAWEYETGDDAAWRAIVGWDGDGAPAGFLRCLLSPDAPEA